MIYVFLLTGKTLLAKELAHDQLINESTYKKKNKDVKI